MKKLVHKNLAIAACIFSMVTTLIFYICFDSAWYDKILALLTTLFYEIATPFAFVQVFKQHKVVIKAGIISLWLIFLIASISSTTAYLINLNNKQMENSPMYREYLEKKSTIQSTLAQNQKRLDKANEDMKTALKNDDKIKSDNTELTKGYNKTIENLTGQKRSLNATLQVKINENSKRPCQNTITRLKNQIKGIDGQIKSTENARDNLDSGGNVDAIQDNIDKYTASVNQNTTYLNSLKPGDIKNQVQTNGFLSFFTPVAKFFNWDPEIISFIFFFIIFGIGPQLAANLFYYVHQKEHGLLNNPGPGGNTPKKGRGKIADLLDKLSEMLDNKTPAPAGPKAQINNDTIDELEEKRKKKTKLPPMADLDPKLVSQYLQIMYDIERLEKTGYAAGYRRISKIMGVKPDPTGRKILNYINLAGIVETVMVDGKRKSKIIKWEREVI